MYRHESTKARKHEGAKAQSLIIICLLIFQISISGMGANSVNFSGYAPEYAGFTIIFNRVSNFIIPETEQVAVIQIAQDGSFNFSFSINEITYIFAELGRFQAYIYVEPGMSYTLVFPPYQPKTEVQRLSPIFRPESIPLGIKNREAQELNKNLTEFNDEFDYHYNTNAVRIFSSNDNEMVKNIESMLEEKFTFSHPYFIKHKQLSYIKLQQLAQRMKERFFLEKLSQFEPDFNMPIYCEVFRNLMSGFLPRNFSGTTEISLVTALNSKMRFDSIIKMLTTDNVFKNNEFAEISLLFMLFESFYNNTMSKSTCVEILNSAIEYASTEKNRVIALELYKTVTKLLPGLPAPEFVLYNPKNKLIQLKDYSGKFVYLCFMQTKNHTCLLDMQSILALEKKFKKDLEIVMIITDDDIEEMNTFLKKNTQYKWDFLHFRTSKKILDDYNVKAVPTYYLINPKGNISLSPAPGPSENFIQLFSDIFVNYRREELRKNPTKERSIFDF